MVLLRAMKNRGTRELCTYREEIPIERRRVRIDPVTLIRSIRMSATLSTCQSDNKVYVRINKI